MFPLYIHENLKLNSENDGTFNASPVFHISYPLFLQSNYHLLFCNSYLALFDLYSS